MSFEELFGATRVMAILRGFGPGASLALAERAWSAGVTALEVPIQHPEDVRALELVAAAARDRGLVVGAGTVVLPEQVDVARRAGAAYAVSPGTDEEVIRTCREAGLPALPGVATPSDIQRCLRLGLTWLKAFPALSLGPNWIHAMHDPFPHIRFVATGGVTVQNAPEFLAAGARVVALGSALSDDAQLARLSELTGG
jgi:Entner-Doudoroff aldolase